MISGVSGVRNAEAVERKRKESATGTGIAQNARRTETTAGRRKRGSGTRVKRGTKSTATRSGGRSEKRKKMGTEIGTMRTRRHRRMYVRKTTKERVHVQPAVRLRKRRSKMDLRRGRL